jgi:hypothetical protein
LKLVRPGCDKDRDGIIAKLSFVDLAGAERFDRTNNSGKRMNCQPFSKTYLHIDNNKPALNYPWFSVRQASRRR